MVISCEHTLFKTLLSLSLLMLDPCADQRSALFSLGSPQLKSPCKNSALYEKTHCRDSKGVLKQLSLKAPKNTSYKHKKGLLGTTQPYL